jgi:hypothetical protein
MSLNNDDYSEQVAQIRDSGDKDLSTFRTKKEIAEEK